MATSSKLLNHIQHKYSRRQSFHQITPFHMDIQKFRIETYIKSMNFSLSHFSLFISAFFKDFFVEILIQVEIALTSA